MAAKRNGPLTDKHLKILNEVIQMCKDTDEYCRKCEECGLNVDPEKRKNNEQMTLAIKLKGVFFPHAK